MLTHTDHLDQPGELFLKENKIPVICLQQDASYLVKNNIIVEAHLNEWATRPLLNGQITAVPVLHGHGWTNRFMANGIGFFLEIPDEPSIYISGDTVFTNDVHRALTQFKPDIAVVATGSASLDIGGPILMPLDEIISFVQKAPKKVIANHMEALNHCSTTRSILKNELTKKGLLSKTFIPQDGETIIIDRI